MSDTKISALTSLTGANVDSSADVLEIVDTSVTTSKKITVAQLFATPSQTLVTPNIGAATGTSLVLSGSITLGSAFVFAAGSAATPSLAFSGDLNTGIYSPGADQVGVSLGGALALHFVASGANYLTVTGGANPIIGVSGGSLQIGAHGVAPPLVLESTDGTNEGGQVELKGAGVYDNWVIDSYQSLIRISGSATGAPYITFDGSSFRVGNTLATSFGFELGDGASGSRDCRIDFHAMSGGGDYEARIIRSGGTNGILSFLNTGTGAMELSAKTLQSTNSFIGTKAFNFQNSDSDATSACAIGVISNDGTVAVGMGSTAAGGTGAITYSGTNVFNIYTTTNTPLQLGANNTPTFLSINGTGEVYQGNAAGATGDTTGFFWIKSCAGAPTGAATAPYTGAVAMRYDSTNNKIYIRSGGTWRSTAALT